MGIFRGSPVLISRFWTTRRPGVAGAVASGRKLLMLWLLCDEIGPIPAGLEGRGPGCRVAFWSLIIDGVFPRSSATALQRCSGGRSGDREGVERTLYLSILFYHPFPGCQVRWSQSLRYVLGLLAEDNS
jgi:hypothetical protein